MIGIRPMHYFRLVKARTERRNWTELNRTIMVYF